MRSYFFLFKHFLKIASSSPQNYLSIIFVTFYDIILIHSFFLIDRVRWFFSNQLYFLKTVFIFGVFVNFLFLMYLVEVESFFWFHHLISRTDFFKAFNFFKVISLFFVFGLPYLFYPFWVLDYNVILYAFYTLVFTYLSGNLLFVPSFRRIRRFCVRDRVPYFIFFIYTFSVFTYSLLLLAYAIDYINTVFLGLLLFLLYIVTKIFVKFISKLSLEYFLALDWWKLNEANI